MRKLLTVLLTVLLCITGCSSNDRAADPLSAWGDTAANHSITEFVERVTAAGNPQFVAAEDRIAVFDNDGTLWAEALLAGDRHEGLLRVLALTHTGITTDEFNQRVTDWMATAHHPRFGKPYGQLTYQPQQQLLNYLRDNGFRTFIVSGGGADFMRVFSQRVYGIPPEQVVGSTGTTRYELREGKPVLVKTSDYVFVDHKAGKPSGIHEFIGHRPILAVGNSDGDQAMLEYTTIDNPRPSLGVLIHHTDADREYAYDAEPPSSGKLVTALEAAQPNGWTVVDMTNDWKTVFAQ
ncbi:HAD family hydrolase [Mycolicibacterium fortuitum]|uniref:HAD family hydrolase n=2 Tax=Mycolicibacterium fortuitum TaxID=1766 RepID=A0AAE5ADF9_MYCFO|nr:HAD family hydrolase [Mycolicibacterium fortuitum]MCV7140975.1 haloacid dehalogenase-like hydrolase [Mycolicibacterium fortuitum]MDV7192780.1 HAD family hydrolase [Mycolicibacterium fortuitum]MDV7205692.1 HAD family hydrolase [Mycolicibacterium fortuitum]MDV7229326.1 HAD family hydrolase [Mycolicibacterium fortuitum]MDV7261166.1 HAD family hydrolase [Mycolicibacterium fortuitum]